MKRHTFRRYMGIAKQLLAIVLVSGTMTGLGLGGLVIGISDILNAHSSKEWPTVIGIVIRSKVLVTEHTSSRTDGPSDTDDFYSPDVAYRYVVDGRTLKNDNIRYGIATNKGQAEQIIQQYPKGEEIEIFYDPDDPEQSVLQPGYFGGLLFFPIMGFVAVVAGVFSGWLLWGFDD